MHTSIGKTVALVINERGYVQGLVTLTDVMQALVGEVATVGDEGEPTPRSAMTARG